MSTATDWKPAPDIEELVGWIARRMTHKCRHLYDDCYQAGMLAVWRNPGKSRRLLHVIARSAMTDFLRSWGGRRGSLRYRSQKWSGDAPATDWPDDARTLFDTLDNGTSEPDDIVDRLDMEQRVAPVLEVVETLRPLERDTLYALMDPDVTLQSVADQHGVCGATATLAWQAGAKKVRTKLAEREEPQPPQPQENPPDGTDWETYWHRFYSTVR